MHVEEAADMLNIVIGGKRICWPAGFSNSDLPWLFAEVFSPYAQNPSSYDHPAVCVRTGDWVVDAGACEGFFTKFALEKGASQVIAVEPVSLLQKALGLTFSDEVIKGRVIVAGVALAEMPGTCVLSTSIEHACDSSMVEPNVASGEGITVSTIDGLACTHALSGSGVIKMDIEGAEMAALRGAGQTLATLKPRLAIAVYHEYGNAAECRDIIMAANPSYEIEFRGMYGYQSPPRPYMLFAR
jgi:FkbM family methyltransferase